RWADDRIPDARRCSGRCTRWRDPGRQLPARAHCRRSGRVHLSAPQTAADAAGAEDPMKALQLWLAALLIAGCASFFTNPALEEARALVAQDRVEEAIALVQSLLKDDPTNAEYKNFVARQRELAVGRLLAQGDSARRAGALEEAQNAYARVQRLEPLNSRASAGLAAVQMDLRHRKILGEAEAACAKKDFAGAEARLAAIFTQNPQHRGALELQRKLVERRAFAESAPPVLGPAFQKPISVEFRDANLR